MKNYKICFYVPLAHTEAVKNALFEKGAGKIGNYSKCCWQTKGTGQFCPMPGSNPFLGEINKVEYVEENKVEMLCEETYLSDVIQTLKRVHPYEEPAYDVYVLEATL